MACREHPGGGVGSCQQERHLISNDPFVSSDMGVENERFDTRALWRVRVRVKITLERTGSDTGTDRVG